MRAYARASFGPPLDSRERARAAQPAIVMANTRGLCACAAPASRRPRRRPATATMSLSSPHASSR